MGLLIYSCGYGCNMANRFLSLVLILYLSTFRLGKAEPDDVCIGVGVNCTPSDLDDSTCCNGTVCVTNSNSGKSTCSYCTSHDNSPGIAACCEGYYCNETSPPYTCTCVSHKGVCNSTKDTCCMGFTCFNRRCEYCRPDKKTANCESENPNCCPGYFCHNNGGTMMCVCPNDHEPWHCGDTRPCCEHSKLTCFKNDSSGNVTCVNCTSLGNSCGEGIPDCCDGYWCDHSSSTPTCNCSNFGDSCGTTGSLNCCDEYTCVADGSGGSTCSDCIKRSVGCNSSPDSKSSCCLGLTCFNASDSTSTCIPCTSSDSNCGTGIADCCEGYTCFNDSTESKCVTCIPSNSN